MPDYFKAVAVDFDGTLTTGERPEPAVLSALADSRAQGRRLLLVTGRTLEHLSSGFGDAGDWFDAIVAENGAVIRTPLGTRLLADPINPVIAEALTTSGISHDRGQVILGCAAAHEHLILDEIRRLGADYQLIRNREALMVIPAGVTKASGLVEALDEIGLSPHSTVGIGDAENDHALLERCEIGVAVDNAVDALKRRADIVTRSADGRGVIELLRGDLLNGIQRIHPARWRIPLGTYLDGTAATIPASQVNLLVTGGTQAGKSYLTGLIAERLIQLAYSVLIIDAEGDHTTLAELQDVVHLDAHEPVPSAGTLRNLLSHHGGSIIADLSQLTSSERSAWYQQAPAGLAGLRSDRGLPHWVIIDEAHESLGHDSASRQVFNPSRKGHCLVTYHPTELCAEARDSIDLLIAAPPTNLDVDDSVIAATASFTGLAVADVLEALASLTPGSALLVDSTEPHAVRPFRLGTRLTAHVRHWHKYAKSDLPEHLQFFFRSSADRPAGQIAANLGDFHHQLARCEPGAITHHAGGRDFSRWIRGVFRDDRLAAEIERIETDLVADWEDRVETARRRLLTAIEQRYPA